MTHGEAPASDQITEHVTKPSPQDQINGLKESPAQAEENAHGTQAGDHGDDTNLPGKPASEEGKPTTPIATPASPTAGSDSTGEDTGTGDHTSMPGTAAGFEVDSSGTVSDARDLRRPDNQVVLSGHGGIDAGDTATTRVPENTCVAFYCGHGGTIEDSLGNAVETGRRLLRRSWARVRQCRTTG